MPSFVTTVIFSSAEQAKLFHFYNFLSISRITIPFIRSYVNSNIIIFHVFATMARDSNAKLDLHNKRWDELWCMQVQQIVIM